ncbi:lipopolysaccharide biosynthesis protein [Pararhodobacter zhoushanensis]|uniref:lipopolysaccharide biosynthesis protein n=1 Tax=Pararhodobacter zhoushanensis TaxID=2479545 RepID=UPI000F8CCB80|nr:hypothetical protein [Pararhodobacter zhoushanensis]
MTKRGFIALFVARGGIVGVNVLSLLVVAAVMEPAAFGSFVYLWSLTLFLAALAGMGSPAYLLRETSARQGDPQRGLSRLEAVKVALILPLGMLAVLCLAAVLLPEAALRALGQGPLDMGEVLPVGLAALVVMVLTHAATPFRLDGRETLSMALRDGAPQSLIMLAVLIGQLVGLQDAHVALLLFAALGLMLVAGLYALIRIRTPLWRDGPGLPRGGQPSFWGSSVLGATVSQVDILLGGLVLGPVALGHYQILKRIANLTAQPQVIANWSVLVRIGRSHAQGKLADVQQACRQGLKLAFFPGIGLLLILVALLPLALGFYDIENSAETWTIFGLLALGSLANVAFGVNFTVAAQSGLEKFSLGARVVSLGLMAGGILLQGDAMTSQGLALSVLVAVAVSNLLLSCLIWRRLGVDTTLLSLLPGRKGRSE